MHYLKRCAGVELKNWEIVFLAWMTEQKWQCVYHRSFCVASSALRHTVQPSDVFAINLALRALLCGVLYKQWANLLPVLSPAETLTGRPRWRLQPLLSSTFSAERVTESPRKNPNLIRVYMQIIPAEPLPNNPPSSWPGEMSRTLRSELAATGVGIIEEREEIGALMICYFKSQIPGSLKLGITIKLKKRKKKNNSWHVTD